MKKTMMCVASLLFSAALWAQSSVETERQYLSGTGCDDMVQWDFMCTSGNNSGKWTKIGVPSCWECQGFGTFQYGMKFYGKAFPEGIADEKGMYKYEFTLPESWNGKQVELIFEAAMTDMQAVNDMLAENSQLRSELQIAQEALEESGQAMTDLEEEKAQLSDSLAQAQADSQALTILAQAESLAAQDDQEGAAALLAPYAGENPTLLSDGSTLEEALTRVEAGLQEDQSDYSPLARYEALVGGEQP